MLPFRLALAVVLLSAAFAQAQQPRSPYAAWKHSGSLFILTTPLGANLPASAVVHDFPLLVRLNADWFDFKAAGAKGEDIRFTSSDGKPFAYEIEEWDVAGGSASIWVRIPRIQGNEDLEIRVFWGKVDAASESNGKAVFGETNGYLSVLHLNGNVTDTTGNLVPKDVGTTPSAGAIGRGRHFAGQQGIFCGDTTAGYPTGSESHTTEAWFRAEKANGTIVGWGNEKAQGKVVMQYRSPPHLQMDCYFSDANVEGKSKLSTGKWVHAVHTYQKGESRVYIDGQLDGISKSKSAPLAIKSPLRMFVGGWYNNYSFVGDIDEVRVSKVVRSADWIRLQYENQKPMQTVVGPIVQSGDTFSVSQASIEVAEGQKTTVTAKADGARKVFWVLTRGGKESIVAVDRFSYTLDAGRVTRDETLSLQFQAVYAKGVKSKEVAVTVCEAIPEPIFTLKAPAQWDGRTAIEVVPVVTNLEAMRAKGADRLNIVWSVGEIATIKEAVPGKLILKRAQNSGRVTVTATIDNGGKPTVQSVTIVVLEPKSDARVVRVPVKDEKPQDNQFYARDDKNEGTLHYNGTLAQPADSVYLKLYADDKLITTREQKPGANGAYALSVALKAGLIRYRIEFGLKTGGVETVLQKVGNLVCGDAWIIQGQSNAVATDFGKEDPAYRSDWIRTFGSMSGNPKGVAVWGNAVHRSRDAEKLQIGYWGMELGRRLVEAHKIPVCFLNGAVGGTRIDQHQRSLTNPEDPTTIYGRLLWRVRQAGLTHGIRGIIWHQGENDQGADGPTGGFGFETYRELFIELAASWKQDFPNVQHYYAYQIWPKSCSMGIDGSDNRLREMQRKLPTAFSRLSTMSTLGINPPGGCHFPAAGYAEFARLLCPLIERDSYGIMPGVSITPANLQRTSAVGDEIVLEFDQPVKWDDAIAGQFYVDGEGGRIVSGRAVGNSLRLKLMKPGKADKLTYLDSKSWSQKTLLWGQNGIAALTFCEVPIEPEPPRKPNP